MEDSALSVEFNNPIGKDQKKQKLSFSLLEKRSVTKRVMEALTGGFFIHRLTMELRYAYYFTLIKSGAARGKFGVQARLTMVCFKVFERIVRRTHCDLSSGIVAIFLRRGPFLGSDNRVTVAGRKNALRAWLLSKL